MDLPRHPNFDSPQDEYGLKLVVLGKHPATISPMLWKKSQVLQVASNGRSAQSKRFSYKSTS